MIIFYDDHRKLLRSLLTFQVEFILVGGYAVNYHGYNRPTGDMDIWLKPDNENKEKLISVLRNEKFSKSSIDSVMKLDFSTAVFFYFGNAPLRVDFLTKISGIRYPEAYSKRQMMPMEDFFVPVIHLDHLILSKISNDRTKDKLDVEELQKIIKIKKDKKFRT